MTTGVVDAEMGAKLYLKPRVTLVSGRVFFAVPAGQPSFPMLTVAMVSGGVDNDETGLDKPRLTFDCWGKTKADASALRLELVYTLRGIRSVPLDDSTFCYEVLDITSTWQPDDDAGLARYVCDATFVCRPL